MKTLKSLLAALLLSSCASVPQDVDVLSGTSPSVGAVAGWLIPQLELSRPVMIVDRHLLEHGQVGWSEMRPDHYLIALEERFPEEARVMVLMHELAHVLRWDRGDLSPAHDAPWGIAFADIHRTYAGEP